MSYSHISIYESFLSAVQFILLLHPKCIFIFYEDFNLSDTTWSNDKHKSTHFSNSDSRVYFVPEINYVSSTFLISFSKYLKFIEFDKNNEHIRNIVSGSHHNYEVFSNLQAYYKSESKKCYLIFNSY